MIDSGEKGYKLPEQILFNSLVLYLTLCSLNHEAVRAAPSADPEGGRGSGPPLENHKLYGFL